MLDLTLKLPGIWESLYRDALFGKSEIEIEAVRKEQKDERVRKMPLASLNSAIIFGAVLLLLQGCNEDLQLSATPIKNVEKITVGEKGELDVYCPTGICQFELAANKEAAVNVNMHYDISRQFDKIEGVSVAGKLSSSVKMTGPNTFSMDVSGNGEPAKVQVVDYYRN